MNSVVSVEKEATDRRKRLYKKETVKFDVFQKCAFRMCGKTRRALTKTSRSDESYRDFAVCFYVFVMHNYRLGIVKYRSICETAYMQTN